MSVGEYSRRKPLRRVVVFLFRDNPSGMTGNVGLCQDHNGAYFTFARLRSYLKLFSSRHISRLVSFDRSRALN